MKPADDPTSIGCILVRMGILTSEQLQRGVETKARAEPDTLLGMILVAQKAITSEELKEALGVQKGLHGRRREKRALAQATIAAASVGCARATASRVRSQIQMRFAANGRHE